MNEFIGELNYDRYKVGNKYLFTERRLYTTMNTPKKMIFEDSVSSNHKENKLSYDDAFKRFFSRKAVLAVLLREIIPDYHDLSIS